MTYVYIYIYISIFSCMHSNVYVQALTFIHTPDKRHRDRHRRIRRALSVMLSRAPRRLPHMVWYGMYLCGCVWYVWYGMVCSCVWYVWYAGYLCVCDVFVYGMECMVRNLSVFSVYLCIACICGMYLCRCFWFVGVCAFLRTAHGQGISIYIYT